ncbi:MAG: beta-lactamase family protein, partial [Abditibacteriales bacterium]|nr:beta-lactamase family protein [Abditibacteriales bacterium]
MTARTASFISYLSGLLESGVTQKLFTCASLILGGRDGTAFEKHVGDVCPPYRLLASPSTIFDLASLTKPLATASSLLLLAQQRCLHLSQALSHFFPLSSGSPLRMVTLRHLITHTSGLPAWEAFYREHHTKDDVLAAVLHTPLEAPPGARYRYSDLGFMLLSAVVERVAGTSLADFAQREIFRPLDMTDTMFCPPSTLLPQIVPTEFDKGLQRHLRGTVHDENARAMGGVGGHAGLFSTARDVAKFCQAMLNGGGLFSKKTLRLMWENQLTAIGAGSSCGWFTPPNPMLPGGDAMPPSAFGHTGFTGTSAVILPEQKKFLILLT